MTDKLRELVERLENSSPYGFNLHHEAAAALRELIEQTPVAVNDGNGFITPHGDPVPIGPLYAMPVAQAEPTPGYCKHCKQYTIEEALPARLEDELYKFAGWLTTRDEVLHIGSICDAAPVADAVHEYIKTSKATEDSTHFTAHNTLED